MQATILPGNLHGSITAPASKSAMQRACAAALIRGGETILHNPGIAADDKAALGLIRALGATVIEENGTVRISSNGIQPAQNILHCGESGLSVRMFTPVAAVSEAAFTITGSGSLLRRPLGFFDTVLPQLDVKCNSTNGALPLHIQGPLQPRDITIDGSLSSQFLTGLLLAYAAAGADGVTITVEGLASKPYIDLTLQLMRDFGLPVPANKDYRSFIFHGGKKTISDPLHYTIEGDWSGGAFLLVAGAVCGPLLVKGLSMDSPQADRAVMDALHRAGAQMQITKDGILVQPSALQSFHFDAVDCPDLFPPLAALAAHANGTSVIKGVHRLTHKESNRAETIRGELGKMGIAVAFEDDTMQITGGSVKGAAVTAHGDHRIAMACAVAALKATGTTVIHEAEAVKKSYPQFWQHLQDAGAQVTLNDI